jgi:hypothetical protein
VGPMSSSSDRVGSSRAGAMRGLIDNRSLAARTWHAG